MKPPQQFNEETYTEVKAIIKANAEIMAPDAQLALAHIAGGTALGAAVNPLDFPPCSENLECAECWVNKWCIHKETPPEIRITLINALGILTTPDLKIPEKLADRIRTLDKTSTTEIGKVIAIAGFCHTQIMKEKAKNDKTEDTTRDSTS